jgi:phosphoglycolate phosphatase
VRFLYLDLDGTLLGRRGSLLHDGEGAVTLLGVRALEACLRADVEVVLVSGRRRATVDAPARLFGQSSYVFEAGSCLVLDGEEQWLTGGIVPGERTIFEQIADGGAPQVLLERFAGRLEPHDPWHVDRDVSHLFRGLVDAFEADEALAATGHGDLRLVDNGVLHNRFPRLAALPQVRAYHLLPAAASKARAVQVHMRARGLSAAECVAIGDSREDLGMAPAVGTFWLVANALARDPTIGEAIAGVANVRVCEGAHGAGVYEAVVTTLAERGARV